MIVFTLKDIINLIMIGLCILVLIGSGLFILCCMLADKFSKRKHKKEGDNK